MGVAADLAVQLDGAHADPQCAGDGAVDDARAAGHDRIFAHTARSGEMRALLHLAPLDGHRHRRHAREGCAAAGRDEIAADRPVERQAAPGNADVAGDGAVDNDGAADSQDVPADLAVHFDVAARRHEVAVDLPVDDDRPAGDIEVVFDHLAGRQAIVVLADEGCTDGTAG